MPVTGHKKDKTFQHYGAKAKRKVLAGQAMSNPIKRLKFLCQLKAMVGDVIVKSLQRRINPTYLNLFGINGPRCDPFALRLGAKFFS